MCSSDSLQAVAEDMKYHLPCLVKAKRDIQKAKQPKTGTVKFGQLLSDLQILDMVETELNNDSKDVVLNINDVHQMYLQLLEENEHPMPENPQYKPYLKQLILDNIKGVHFSRPPDKTKPEQILSTRSKDSLIASAVNEDDLKLDLKVLLTAAKILRKDIATSCSWKFHGTFADYEPPTLLNTFCKYAVHGIGRIKSDLIDRCHSKPIIMMKLLDNTLRLQSVLT